MKKKKAVSDGHLDRLFRLTVRVVWNFRCAHEDEDCDGPLEAHHFQHRSKGVLRWAWKNGILLCKKHHAWADSIAGREWVTYHLDVDYLRREDILLPDYLIKHGLSNDEFRLMRAKELKNEANKKRPSVF